MIRIGLDNNNNNNNDNSCDIEKETQLTVADDYTHSVFLLAILGASECC